MQDKILNAVSEQVNDFLEAPVGVLNESERLPRVQNAVGHCAAA